MKSYSYFTDIIFSWYVRCLCDANRFACTCMRRREGSAGPGGVLQRRLKAQRKEIKKEERGKVKSSRVN